MRFVPLISSLLAVASAAPLAEENSQLAAEAAGEVTQVTDASTFQAEASSGASPSDSTAQGVKILPKFKEESPKDGAKRTTIKYGTWSVTSTKMLQTTKLSKGPCPVSGCLVTAMEATIRYPDGSEANADTGAWMHHIALFGSGGGQGSIWAAGNERPTLRLNDGGSKYGLDFPSAFMMMVDLMTEDTKPKSLSLEITYEHVPKSQSGYKAAAMYWLSVGEPAAKDGVYKFTSLPSMSGYNARLLYAIGHMHDGGTDMRLFVNGKMTCKSVMHYSTPGKANADMGDMEEAEAEEEEAPKKTTKKASGKKSSSSMEGMSHSHTRRDGHGGHGGHGGGDMNMPHIEAPGACTNFGSVSRGDRLTSEAWYDAVKHPLMVHNGKKENLMGNMRVYIGPN